MNKCLSYNKITMSENKPYSMEELNTRLDRVNGWINNCDQKASILLAFVGAMTAVLCTSDLICSGRDAIIKPFMDYWLNDIPYEFSIRNLLLFTLLIPVSYNGFFMIKFLLLVLKPKTKIVDIDSNSDSSITRDSALHYQTIAQKKFNAFNQQCIMQTEEQYLNDLCSQIYCNLLICNDKFENYRSGVHHFELMSVFVALEVLVLFLIP